MSIIRIPISTLDNFQLYREGIYSKDDLVKKIESKGGFSPRMMYGTAVHTLIRYGGNPTNYNQAEKGKRKILQEKYKDSYDSLYSNLKPLSQEDRQYIIKSQEYDEHDGSKWFGHSCSNMWLPGCIGKSTNQLHLELKNKKATHEYKTEKSIYVANRQVLLSGRIDAITTQMVYDHKTTSQLPTEVLETRYFKSPQWRFYLYMTDTDKATYNSFVIPSIPPDSCKRYEYSYAKPILNKEYCHETCKEFIKFLTANRLLSKYER